MVNIVIYIPTANSKSITYPNIEQGRYIIYDNGDVIDLKRDRYVTKEINKKGYVYVRLKHVNGKRQHVFVHRLVAWEFIPNPENKKTVNHEDGNKTNNHWTNLSWMTHDEQMEHANRIGLFDHKYETKIGENGCKSKYPNSLIIEIYELHKSGMPVYKIAKLLCDKYPEYEWEYKKIRTYIYGLLRDSKFLKKYAKKFND